MRRLAQVCSWIVLVLFILLAISSFVVGTRSAGFAVVPAVVFGAAVVAFHSGTQRWISGLALALNALFAIGACVFIVFGINFAAGAAAFLAAGALFLLVCGPAVLNIVAFLPHALGRNAVPAS
jgi:hypothetical protein